MGLFQKVVGQFVELDESAEPAKTTATATSTASSPSIAPPSMVTAGHPSVAATTTPEDVKRAQNELLNNMRYAEKQNLVKHTTMVTKLSARTNDEDMAIALAFDSLEVNGVTKQAIIEDAQACIVSVDKQIKDAATFADADLQTIATQQAETIARFRAEDADCARQIDTLHNRRTEIANKLATIDVETAAKRAVVLSKRDLITAIAIELRAAWQKVISK